MSVQEQIGSYMAGQPRSKADDLQRLHQIILGVCPDCKLWFLDGRNEDGKVVTNPNIGYGSQAIKYANGDTKEFYRIGLSANSAGLSIYVMGVADKRYLSETYGQRLGKASITGYCIKIRHVKDIDLGVFEELVARRLGAE